MIPYVHGLIRKIGYKFNIRTVCTKRIHLKSILTKTESWNEKQKSKFLLDNILNICGKILRTYTRESWRPLEIGKREQKENSGVGLYFD